MRWLFPSLTVSPRKSHLVGMLITLITGATIVSLVSCTSGVDTTASPDKQVPLYASATGDTLRLSMTSQDTFYSSTEDISIVLSIQNNSEKPVKLHYSSSQHFDLAVLGAENGEVFRWSNDRAFQEALEKKTLKPNEDFSETLTWPGDKEGQIPLRLPGSYRIIGNSSAKEAKGIEVKGDISIK